MIPLYARLITSITSTTCAVCLTFSSCRSGGAQNKVCPSIYIQPHAVVEFKPPLNEASAYTLKVQADEQTEECSLTVSNIGAAVQKGDMVSSPTTRTDTDCRLITVSGILNDGSLAGLKTAGTPKRLKLRVTRRGGTNAVRAADLQLEYKDTELKGEGCGFTKFARVVFQMP